MTKKQKKGQATLNSLVESLLAGDIDPAFFMHRVRVEMEMIIGNPVDLLANYESAEVDEGNGRIAIPIHIGRDDSEASIHMKMVHLSHFATDLGNNNLQEEQMEKLDDFIE